MSQAVAEFSTGAEVRNAKIERELDHTRVSSLWRAVRVIMVVVGLLLLTAWQQSRIAQLGYELQQVQRWREDEDHLHEHLTLEADSLRAPARLAAQAERLNLKPAEPSASFFVERVTTSAPPDRSVVAAR
jgi:cell division protein FtsL